MRSFTLQTLLAASVSTAIASTPVQELEARSSSVTSITIKGNAFYQGSDRFYIRGVDYQPGGGSGAVSDPIADSTSCLRDIPYFTKLGINTIRVYAVDNTANHDTCMNALAAAGIYLVLDTDTPLYSLNRADPEPSYNSIYLQSVFATIDAFAGYSNTMAFLSGNEVINNASNTNTAPYVKAVTRDMKQYMSDQKLRTIPVGYAAADVDANQQLMAEYLNCESNRADFYSINDYSWCSPSTFQTSGWETLVANYTGYGLPLFMSEYGCITNTRNFEEVATLYSDQMTSVFSGGLVYEYSDEGNGYGLVTINSGKVTIGAGFTYLMDAFTKTANPTGDGEASTTSTASECPPQSAQWEVSSNDLPALPVAAKKLMTSGAGTGPGLSGTGSQSSATGDELSSGTAQAGSSTSGSSSTATSSSTKSRGTRMEPVDMKLGGVALISLFSVMCGMALL